MKLLSRFFYSPLDTYTHRGIYFSQVNIYPYGYIPYYKKELILHETSD